MKVKLNVLYMYGYAPILLNDSEYEEYKEKKGLCEKQNVLYDKTGFTTWFVNHTEIEVDTSSEYSRGWHAGMRGDLPEE